MSVFPDAAASVDTARRLKRAALSLGFDHVAFSRAEIFAEDGAFLKTWCDEGSAGGMTWLSREPSRRADPRSLFPRAVSVISLGVRYFQGPIPPRPDFPAGRVARYAWGEDYHEVIGRRVEEFREFFHREFGAETRSALDVQAFLERAAARRAGLGFVGKNTNLIVPRGGSWIFLAEILTELDLPSDSPAPQGCGGCRECGVSCPTGALETPFSLDARLCVSYHTIENRGEIPREIRRKMGLWVFGCDDCQEVCPFNARAKETLWPEFRTEKGVGAWISLEEILKIRTTADFKKKFRGTPLLRAKRKGLLRNAAVAAVNGGWVEALSPALEETLFIDTEPVARSHAAWALGQSGKRDVLKKAYSSESDATVREEIEWALNPR